MTNELELYKEMGALTPEVVQAQVNLMQRVMGGIMKENVHYGKIPGTGDKPTLLKPGAEKLCVTFRLSPTYDVQEIEHPDGHLEYRVKCTLTHIPTGQVFGQGLGSCSTLEGKYRYRKGEPESTGKPVPKEYWDKRDPAELGGKEFCASKIDGQWMICRKGEKVEHDNPADYYNTVLKMSKKRAHVDAVLTCTAASDIFTQDIEDMPEVIPGADAFKQEKAPDQPVDTTKAGVDDIPLTHEPPEEDDSEKDWREEEARQAKQGEQTSIPTNEYEGRPFPGTKQDPDTASEGTKISKRQAGFIYGLWKNVPNWDDNDREQFLKDIGFESLYEVTEDVYQEVKGKLLQASGKK